MNVDDTNFEVEIEWRACTPDLILLIFYLFVFKSNLNLGVNLFKYRNSIYKLLR